MSTTSTADIEAFIAETLLKDNGIEKKSDLVKFLRKHPERITEFMTAAAFVALETVFSIADDTDILEAFLEHKQNTGLPMIQKGVQDQPIGVAFAESMLRAAVTLADEGVIPTDTNKTPPERIVH